MLRRKITKSSLDFIPVNERMCKIRLKGHFRNITIIAAHAPTEEKADEEKEQFYDVLTTTCNQTPRYDTLIMMGDFNARIDRENFMKPVAGNFTIHEETNENRKHLGHFATMNNMIIKSTCFKHKIIHKGTWKVPGGVELTRLIMY
jgi:exonuclease III